MIGQLLQNPMYRQMMDGMFSNPQLMEQMMLSHPMFANDPNARERIRQTMQMMQNEDFRRMMMNPEVHQAMANISTNMQDLQRLGLGPGVGAGSPGPG